MAPLHPDRRLRGPLSALAAAGALLCLPPVYAANAKCDATKDADFTYTGDRVRSPTPDTLSIENLKLCQGTSFLSARKADASGLDTGDDKKSTWGENGTWILTGEVHVEFDGGVLDAQMATAVFSDGALKSVKAQLAPVQTGQPLKSRVRVEFKGAVLDAQTAFVVFAGDRMKTVQAEGTQAAPVQFSHQVKNSTRRTNGRARKADYDAATSILGLSDTWYSDGSTECETQTLRYNVSDGSGDALTPSRCTVLKKIRVPAPSTPDRATAK